MKKMLRLMAVAIVALTMAACGGNNTPEGAAQKFLKVYQNGDYKAMVDQMHFTKEATDEQKAQFASLIEQKVAGEIEKKGGIESFEVKEAQVAEDGQSAKVEYILHFGNGTESDDTLKLVLVDGKWMVDGGK